VISTILLLTTAFLPLLVSLRGKGGVWQFLSLLFCGLAIAAFLSVGFIGWILTWVVAWIFAGIALQSRPSAVAAVAPPVAQVGPMPPGNLQQVERERVFAARAKRESWWVGVGLLGFLALMGYLTSK
jgi:hypothetical protein